MQRTHFLFFASGVLIAVFGFAVGRWSQRWPTSHSEWIRFDDAYCSQHRGVRFGTVTVQEFLHKRPTFTGSSPDWERLIDWRRASEAGRYDEVIDTALAQAHAILDDRERGSVPHASSVVSPLGVLPIADERTFVEALWERWLVLRTQAWPVQSLAYAIKHAAVQRLKWNPGDAALMTFIFNRFLPGDLRSERFYWDEKLLADILAGWKRDWPPLVVHRQFLVPDPIVCAWKPTLQGTVQFLESAYRTLGGALPHDLTIALAPPHLFPTGRHAEIACGLERDLAVAQDPTVVVRASYDPGDRTIFVNAFTSFRDPRFASLIDPFAYDDFLIADIAHEATHALGNGRIRRSCGRPFLCGTQRYLTLVDEVATEFLLTSAIGIAEGMPRERWRGIAQPASDAEDVTREEELWSMLQSFSVALGGIPALVQLYRSPRRDMAWDYVLENLYRDPCPYFTMREEMLASEQELDRCASTWFLMGQRVAEPAALEATRLAFPDR